MRRDGAGRRLDGYGRGVALFVIGGSQDSATIGSAARKSAGDDDGSTTPRDTSLGRRRMQRVRRGRVWAAVPMALHTDGGQQGLWLFQHLALLLGLLPHDDHRARS